METGYIRDVWEFPDGSKEVEEKHTGRYGAKGMPRKKKEKASPEAIEYQNQWKRETTVRRLIKWNFKPGDYWVTLTYRKGERPSYEALKKDVAKFIRKTRQEYRKAGQEMKYIYRMEIGKKGAPHMHILLNRFANETTATDEILRKTWTAGHAAIKSVYADGDYRALAEYITKKPGDWEPAELKNYISSRNLTRKEAKRKVIHRRTLGEGKMPTAPKGYYVDPDSVRMGINPITGYRYRHYTLIEVKRRN